MKHPAYLAPDLRHVSVEENRPGEFKAICPSIAEVAPDTFVIAYHRTSAVDFHGTYGVWLSETGDGGASWGEPRAVAEGIQAPGLLRLPDGELLLNGCEHHGDSRVLFAYNWNEIPWNRDRRCHGGTRLAIAGKEWLGMG